MPVPSDVEALIAAEQAEWGQYVAVGPIFLDGARAFNEGHAVPASHVEKFDLLTSGQVRPVGQPPAPKADPPKPPKGDDVVLNPITTPAEKG